MEKTKNEFHRGKQRYKCKCRGCNCTGSRNGYPDHTKQKLLNKVKQFASKFKNIPKNYEKVDILDLDEMCVSSGS